MELKIYNSTGALKLTASPNSTSTVTGEVMGEYAVSAAFTHTAFVQLDVNDYVLVEGVKYKLKAAYKPVKKNTQTFSYQVKFYAPIHDAEDALFLYEADGDTTTEFSYDGGPREHLQLWVDNMNRIAGGDLWSIGTVVTGENRTIDYRNVYCWEAAFGSNGIAATYDTELWADGYVVNLCKASRGEIVELGYQKGLTQLQPEENGEMRFFTRLFPLGSTRNIDPTKYGASRLQLPSREKYVDRNVDLYGVKEAWEEAAFADIYPKYVGSVTSVRSEQLTNEEGREYTVYYFKDSGMTFNPNDYEIPEYTKMLAFQTGDLAGRGNDEGSFEANWHADTQEWEIINVYPDEETQLPGGMIVPQPGDTYIPWNFRMPDEYVTAAEEAYRQAVDDFLASYSFDPTKYTAPTDRHYVERNAVPLMVGQNVRLLSDEYFTGGYKDTRITKVVRKLNDLCQATLTCTDKIGTGWKTSVDNQLSSLQYKLSKQAEQAVIDIIKTTDTKTPSDWNVFSALRALRMFLRKDKPDETNYLLKLLGGVLIDGLARFGDFITGVSGAMIDKNGDAEFRSIYARKRIFTPEVAYNRVTYIKGKFIISPGGGCTVDTVTDNGDGTYTIKPDLTDADGLSQFKGDYLTTYFVTKNEEGKLTGFEEMKFIVVSSDFSAKTFVISAKPGNDWKPIENMVLAQTGNATDPDRQTYTIIDVTNGNNCITFFEHANTWDPEPAQMPGWLGKKKGMVINGINCDNYSAVLQQVLITGLIFQIDEITGESVRVPIWKGTWEKGKKYGYFNEVSHNGSRYLCINTEGTEEEPGTGQDWLLTVEKGQKGDAGLSVVGGGHWESSKTPYAANTLVTMYNCVFISLVETSNPPIAIAKFADGRYIRTTIGYILAGKSADFEVHPDWTMLLDGRQLKGTSITFLGSFTTAPSNPVEGNSYYNTTDKCTYIWQNGRWMLMVSDGKDGRDYEYIYQRNNSVGIVPNKPDSLQQDDYVPEGWTDDFLGVDADHQVEWGCKRTKRDGVWSEWSTPAVVHRWSKDGENAVIADLDNEMVNCAMTSDGKVSKAQSWTTNVTMWYGYEELELTALTATQPSGLTVRTDKQAGIVNVSASAGAVLAETSNVIITLTASKNGQNFERKLTFTVAGVRAGTDGNPGEDAVLYALVPSASSVAKYKDGTFSVSSVSCTRQKTVGGTINETTEGELKYSLDGGAEQPVNNGQAIATTLFNKSIKFLLYVNSKLVDVETIPMLTDGTDGTDGQDGSSVEVVGHWESANVPYRKNQQVNFSHGSFVALRDTSEPPLAISRFNNGKYRRTTRGYILAGRLQDMAVHADWQMVAWTDPSIVYRLDCPVTAFSYTSTGSLSPSSVEVTCKQINGQESSLCSSLYLVGRRYNRSSWSQFISPTQANKVSVTPAAGYTQFTIRAYKSSSDASAWNDSYVAELGIGVAERGIDGQTLGFLYDCGVFQSGKSYVWNSDRRDKVIYKIENTYYNFLVKNFGSTVTAAPTSATGDSNWEALQKFASIVTDTFFADGANIAGLMFKLTGYTEAGIPVGEIRSQNTGTDGQPVLSFNTLTGKFVCQDADITGTIRATDGYFRGIVETAASGKRIVINPATNSFKMIDAGNKELVSINFSSIEGYDVGLIRMDAYQGGEIAYTTDVSPTHVSISGPLGLTTITSQTLLAQDAAAQNNVEIRSKAISIKYENTQYNGVDGEYNIAVGAYARTLKFVHGVLVSVK